MARLNRPTNGSTSPVTKYLNWKSNDKSFAYYDKEQGKNVLVELPIKFLFLEHYHTVKGWNDASESGIYSNDVYSIGKEELSVKAFKGGEIGKGLYKDIKEQIKNAGAVYHRSVYGMLPDGSIVNVQLKGSGVKAYSDFYNDNNHLLDNQWIEINQAKEGKKGAVKFTTPEFKIGENITKAEDKLANDAASKLQGYMDTYFGRVSDDNDEMDEVPF
ncbi:MAG: hypothetical protein ACSHXA_16340 [Polaribacter sp.]|uniref:hypothetical protein n=1 Tax=Polaribacter sp. TaxID=1920175 RepID=UPI003EF9264F